MSRVFANGPEDQGSIPGHVIPKTQKMVLDAACLTLSIIRWSSRVKWSNPGNGVVPPLNLGAVAMKREPSGHPRQRSITTTLM